MKKNTSSIVWLFSIIWNFFFGKKEIEKKVEEKVSIPQIQYGNHPTIPGHNNRKVHKGRFVQYINMGEGRTRAIYHSAK